MLALIDVSEVDPMLDGCVVLTINLGLSLFGWLQCLAPLDLAPRLWLSSSDVELHYATLWLLIESGGSLLGSFLSGSFMRFQRVIRRWLLRISELLNYLAPK